MSGRQTGDRNRRDSYSSYNAYMSRYYGNRSEAYELAPDEDYVAPARRPRIPVIEPDIEPRRRPARKSSRKPGDKRLQDARIKDIRERNRPSYEFVKEKSTIPVLNIVTAFVIAALAFAWLATFAYGKLEMIALADAKARYASVVEKNDNDRYTLSKSVDLKEIETYAIIHLGMQKPEEYQKIHIDVPKASYVESYTIEEKKPETRFRLAGILGFFTR